LTEAIVVKARNKGIYGVFRKNLEVNQRVKKKKKVEKK